MMTQLFTKQRGITFIGLIIVLAIVGFFAVIAIQIFPAYSEYASVKNIIESIAKNADFDSLSDESIRSSFDRGATIGYVSVITGKDLVIENNINGKKVVVAEYQVVKPVVGNVSILMNFKASSDQSNLDLFKK